MLTANYYKSVLGMFGFRKLFPMWETEAQLGRIILKWVLKNQSMEM
jgi:hypothetical protein